MYYSLGYVGIIYGGVNCSMYYILVGNLINILLVYYVVYFIGSFIMGYYYSLWFIIVV